MTLNRLKKYSFLIAAATVVLSGCGAGPQAIDDNYYKSGVERAQQTRTAYLSVQGNYDALPADKKAQLVKLYDGKEDDLKKSWALIAHPPAGMAPGGPTPGPGGPNGGPNNPTPGPGGPNPGPGGPGQ